MEHWITHVLLVIDRAAAPLAHALLVLSAVRLLRCSDSLCDYGGVRRVAVGGTPGSCGECRGCLVIVRLQGTARSQSSKCETLRLQALCSNSARACLSRCPEPTLIALDWQKPGVGLGGRLFFVACCDTLYEDHRCRRLQGFQTSHLVQWSLVVLQDCREGGRKALVKTKCGSGSEGNNEYNNRHGNILTIAFNKGV